MWAHCHTISAGAPFLRPVGVPDIGAYEVQPEIVFNAGFDDC
jgi:hypothetical protein